MSTLVSTKATPLTVSELTMRIKRYLSAHFGSIIVEGEVSNCKRHTSGHLYFSIKDENAQLSCVMFKNAVDKLNSLPKEGDQVRLIGEIDVYLPRGSYQLIVKKLEFSGLGALLLKLEEMKKELQALGYFDQGKKKALPPFPKKIGIVTSPTGAAIQDILHILRRRSKHFHVVIYPVHVQGDTASEEIASAIIKLNELSLVDVIIVARGGGSIEDLWAFNEKIVADAIFKSHIPIISAVGHEIDFTISDFVADLRAPTPSAAAELVMQETSAFEQFLQTAKARALNTLQLVKKQVQTNLKGILSQPVFLSSETLLFRFQQPLDDITEKLQQIIEKKLQQKVHNLALIEQKLKGLQPKAQIQILQQRSSAYKIRIQERSLNRFQQIHSFFEKLNKIYQMQLRSKSAEIKENRTCLQQIQKHIQIRMQSIIQTTNQKLSNINQHIKDISPKALMDKGYALIFAQKDQSIILGVKEMEQNQSVLITMKDGKACAIIKGINHE